MVSVQSIRSWDDPKVSGAVLAAVTVLFFALRTYTVVTLAAYVALVGVFGLFFWQTASKMVSSIQPPPVLKINISEAFIRELVTKLAESAAVASAFLEKLSSTRDAVFSGQIVLALYAIATFGKWFSFLTLAYLAIVGALAWPPIYKKYQVEIDDVYSHGKKWIETQLAAVPGLIPKAEVAKKKQ